MYWLQSGSNQVGSGVTLAILFLVILFFLLPAAFIISDMIQRRDAPPQEGITRTKSVRRPERHLRVVDTPATHPYRYETPPAHHAEFPHDTVGRTGFEHRGHLLIGDRSVLHGDLKVTGSLALGNAVAIKGDVRVHGNLYLDVASAVEGRIRVDGDVWMASWTQVKDAEITGRLEMDTSATIESSMSAGSVRRPGDIVKRSSSAKAPTPLGAITRRRMF